MTSGEAKREDTCPACGKPAFIDARLHLAFHKDGSCAARCWGEGK